MATLSETLKPPITSVGVPGWLRKNLFSSWFNTLLTLIAVWILYGVATGLVGFIESANWGVISTNLRLFMVGQYPIDQVWRVMASIWLLALLIGATWRLWRGTARSIAIGTSAIFLVFALMPFDDIVRAFGYSTVGVAISQPLSRIGIVFPSDSIIWVGRAWFAGSVAMVALGYGIAHTTRSRRLITGGWLASPFVIAILLYGAGPFAIVTTDVWGGLLLTFVLAVSGILLSFPLGLLFALGRQSSYPVIQWFSVLYIEIIRGVPLVTMIFTAQILFPIFLPENVTVERVIRAIAGFTVFTSAYLAEVVRGGLQSIGRGQNEAARAIGLNTFQMLWLVILPQALRNVIPALVGQFISLFKDTSLVAIVGLLDLAGIANAVISQQQFLGRQSEVLLFIAAIYFVCCFAMTFASRQLEKRLGVGER